MSPKASTAQTEPLLGPGGSPEEAPAFHAEPAAGCSHSPRPAPRPCFSEALNADSEAWPICVLDSPGHPWPPGNLGQVPPASLCNFLWLTGPSPFPYPSQPLERG